MNRKGKWGGLPSRAWRAAASVGARRCRIVPASREESGVTKERQLNRTPAEVERENRRLHRAVEELSVLNDLAREIGASLDTEQVMSAIVRRSVKAVGCEEGAVTLIDSDSKPGPQGHTLVRASAGTTDHTAFHVKEALLGWMLLRKHAVVVNRPREDDRFPGASWDPRVRSILCAPLLVRGDLIGVLTVYNPHDPEGFTEDDQRILSIIASQSAQVVENARLYEEERAYELVRRELELAREIQVGLLPGSRPAIPGYDVAGAGIPAREVGGDYFDFIPAADDRTVVCLGDVSGKGLPAALLMANLQATVRGQVHVDPRPSRCLARANTLLWSSTASDRFATLFFGLLDPAENALEYASAGHERPVLIAADDSVRRLETGGTVLSFIEDATFDDDVVYLSTGDTITAYSDGVVDACNEADEQFGEDRLIEVLRERRGAPAGRLIEDVVAAVQDHSGGAPQTDDMTLVVIKRSG
ncbi:MAG: SpoIIE family protein phosphatase [Candidatus Eisenbacteria bacterium]|nr:SpoIIE family protein phosphatase [Candidatus Eisenbacteria bacterium]